MPSRDKMSRSKKGIENIVMETIEVKYGKDKDKESLEKIREKKYGVKIPYGYEKRNFPTIDGGKVHFSFLKGSSMDIKDYVKCTLFKTRPMTGREFFKALMKTFRKDNKWHGVIQNIDDMKQLFREFEICCENEVNGTYDPYYTSTGISKRWLGKENRTAISDLKYKIYFLSGGRIDYITDKMREDGGGCFHGFHGDSTKTDLVPNMNWEFVNLCFTELYLVQKEKSNSKTRKFDVETFKFGNEE